MFKIGDRVRCINTNVNSARDIYLSHKEYTVLSVNNDGLFYDLINILDDSGVVRDYSAKRFELVDDNPKLPAWF